MTRNELRTLFESEARRRTADGRVLNDGFIKALRWLRMAEVDPKYADSPLIGGEFEDSASIGTVLAAVAGDSGSLIILDGMGCRGGAAVIRRVRPDSRFGPRCTTDTAVYTLSHKTDCGPFDVVRPRPAAAER